jgi:hypothetical protein
VASETQAARNTNVGSKQQMKRLLPTILILLFGCNNHPKTDTLTGDLYFDFFRVGNFYNMPDSVINRIENNFDTLTWETTSEEDRRLWTLYKKLKDEKLLFAPFIKLLTEKDSVVTLYLDTLDYNEIKIYKLKRLQDEQKKVRIEAKVKEIDQGLFYCTDLVNIYLVDGATLMKQKKWRIEDYN